MFRSIRNRSVPDCPRTRTGRRIAIAAATAAALAVVSACGSGSGGSGAAGSGGSGQLKIGFVTTLSNNAFSDVGAQAKAAFEAAVAQGSGAGGPSIATFEGDDAGDAQQATQVCQRLIQQDHVSVIVAVMLTPNKNACSLIAQKAGVPFIAGQQSAVNCSSLYFQTGWIPNQVVEPAIAYLAKEGKKTIYFVGNDYAFDTEILQTLTTTAAAHGMKVIGNSLPPIGTTDWSPIFSRVEGAHADVVVDAMVDEIAYQKQAALDPQMSKLDRLSLTVDESQLHSAGGDQQGLQIVTQYVSTQADAANTAFIAAMKKADSSVVPSLTSENLYNATLVAIAAAKKGTSSADIAAQIPHVSVQTPGGTLSFDGAHNPTMTTYVATVGSDLVPTTVFTQPSVAADTGC
jgi:urea transport system substrate-binding protein